MRRSAIFLPVVVALVLAYSGAPTAQSKPTVAPADYDQFESLTPGSARGGLSPDGKWLAYGINRVGGNNELRITALPATPGVEPRIVAFGTQAVFSANSEWLAYAIGQSEAEQERLRTARQPVQRNLGLLNLKTNTETVIDGVESFAFDRTGQSIAMKRYAPVAAGGGARHSGRHAAGRRTGGRRRCCGASGVVGHDPPGSRPGVWHHYALRQRERVCMAGVRQRPPAGDGHQRGGPGGQRPPPLQRRHIGAARA